MSIRILSVKAKAYIFIAIPFLVVGTVSTVVGAYCISISESLIAIWLLLFGFGATSISTIISARVNFLSKPLVRKLFTYPFFTATLILVSYLAVSILNWALNNIAQEHEKFAKHASFASLTARNAFTACSLKRPYKV